MIAFQLATIFIQKQIRGYLVRSRKQLRRVEEDGKGKSPDKTENSVGKGLKKGKKDGKLLGRYLRALDDHQRRLLTTTSSPYSPPPWIDHGFSSYCAVTIQVLSTSLLFMFNGE